MIGLNLNCFSDTPRPIVSKPRPTKDGKIRRSSVFIAGLFVLAAKGIGLRSPPSGT